MNDYTTYTPGGRTISSDDLNKRGQDLTRLNQSFPISVDGADSIFLGRQGTVIVPYGESKVKPLEFFKINETGGLDISIEGGPVHVWNGTTTNVSPLQTEVPPTSADITLTTNSTNYIYLQSTVTPITYNNRYIIWTSDDFIFYKATAEEENTADFTDAVTGEGNVFVKIGEVETDGTEIIEITQIQTTTINLLWPWTMNLVTFGCPA